MALLRFITVDVFTETRFLGNPLVVFPDGRSLAEQQMQAIATEFSYSEAAFVLPPTDLSNDARVRIFTPEGEIPFAGHPNVGVAFVLAQIGRVFGRQLEATVRLEQAAGVVVATILREGGAAVGARILAPQPFHIGRSIEPAAVAPCASLSVDDFLLANHRPTIATVGLPFIIAELKDIEALTTARPNVENLSIADEVFRSGRVGLYLYVRQPESDLRVRARMLAPHDRVTEDPVTGSAAAALAGLLVACRSESELAAHIRVQQGTEIGREGIVDVEVCKASGTVGEIAISGRCVSVMEGTMHL
ncbi:PhzF family phenazine biosynthesis protein [Bradyrhizobium sp. SZCCHNRI1003]|uniref:PhzF family phenazine biosynthesis protein n=1 Tax=Bradyrhizobium sp. SZCCHNRI1003 TaxID=3057275 RepID=UPI002916DB08|nr:PhzF family phenazine biosynthesis protein [Bradyrhizobium sp. SZCCHNRI1003]